MHVAAELHLLALGAFGGQVVGVVCITPADCTSHTLSR